jgi:raffinose/stachyose/melibiose transport system permease protein
MRTRKYSWPTTLVMVPLACLMGLPLYYIVVNTFKTERQASKSPLGLPSPWFFGNWADALRNSDLLRSAGNSLIVLVSSVLLMLFIGSTAAFAMIVRKSRFTSIFGAVLVLAFVVPAQTTLIPLYEMLVGIHLVDELGGLVVLYSGGSVFCYFLIVGYMRTLPFEIIEASRIDGASLVRTYWQIVLPLIRPILITVGVFQSMWVWNDFFYPNVFISSPKKQTLVLEVYTAVSQYTVNWPAFMTTTVIVLVPMVVFFIFAQRHIVSGLISGSLKG